MEYQIIVSNKLVDNIEQYTQQLIDGLVPGEFVSLALRRLNSNAIKLNPNLVFSALLNSKIPMIFAESEVKGDGSDWLPQELSLLGDINIAVPVTVFDDGKHFSPLVHQTPFLATLLFTPGALLRNDHGGQAADLEAVCSQVNGVMSFDDEKYYQLYKNRLLPLLHYCNEQAKLKNQSAFITLPGLGCGQFAGPYIGQLGEKLKDVLIKLLSEHGEQMPFIKAVYFDPYNECCNERFVINNISLMVRPLTQNNHNKAQLNLPVHYQELGDDFSDCLLFSLVAWDHVSWPGNDFYGGSRATDDGVKAAATNSLEIITQVKGRYNVLNNQFEPLSPYKQWLDVVNKNKLQLIARNNIHSY